MHTHTHVFLVLLCPKVYLRPHFLKIILAEGSVLGTWIKNKERGIIKLRDHEASIPIIKYQAKHRACQNVRNAVRKSTAGKEDRIFAY